MPRNPNVFEYERAGRQPLRVLLTFPLKVLTGPAVRPPQPTAEPSCYLEGYLSNWMWLMIDDILLPVIIY